MKYHLRKHMKFGPLRLNFTQNGLSSWSLHFWRFGWNSRRDRITYDTPGPGYVSIKRPRRRDRRPPTPPQEQDPTA